MQETESCSKNVILYPAPDSDGGGQWEFAIPFGEEGRGITDDGELDQQCHDCGVSTGGYHHPGCDVEESPLTGEQLLMEVVSMPDSARPYHARAQAGPHHNVNLIVD